MKKSPKTVLITGGSSGIGRYLAEQFARNGVRVFIGVRQKTPASVEQFNNIHPLFFDVCNANEIANAYSVLTEDYGVQSLDILINNAGSALPGPLELLTVEQIIGQFDVNVFGVVRVTQQFLPLLRSAKGKIINVGSMSGRMSIPFLGAYGASKSALKQLSWIFRQELRPWNIKTFYLEAGNFKTTIWEKSFQQAQRLQGNIYETYLQQATSIIKKRANKVNDLNKIWKVVAAISEHRHHQFSTVVGSDAWIRKILTSLLPDCFLESALSHKFGLKVL